MSMISAAVLSLSVMTAASAARDPLPSAEPAATAGATVPAPQASPARPTTYCIREAVTGSRVPKKICKTRDQWLALGTDPLKPDN